MTPESRAAAAIHRAAELGLVSVQADGPKWHAVIAAALTDALVEARSVCGYLPDRDAISDLMLGRTADAPPPTRYPAAVTCFVCEGSGALGSVTCHACQGVGRIVDHGPPPDPNPGLMAVKSCGCAVDWVGSGAPDEYRSERVNLWASQGYVQKAVDFAEAGPLITAGAACQHEPRATPRTVLGLIDFADMPRSGGA